MPVLRPSFLVRRNAAITLLSLIVMLVVSPLTEALPHGSIIVGPFVAVIFITSIQQAVTHPVARTALMSAAALWFLLQFRLSGVERPVVESLLSSSVLLLLSQPARPTSGKASFRICRADGPRSGSLTSPAGGASTSPPGWTSSQKGLSPGYIQGCGSPTASRPLSTASLINQSR
jgi:hypothetical protein